MNKSRMLKWMAVLAGATAMSCGSSSATNTRPIAGPSNVFEETQSEIDTATASESPPVEDEATSTTEASTTTEVASTEESATSTTDPASPETTKTSTPESAATTSENSDHLSVVELKLAKEIRDRNPVDPQSKFSKGSKVYAWVKLNVTDSETQIKFQWLLDDSVVFTAEPMTVKQSPGWRSWSYKTVDTTGAWKVALLDVDDKVIHSQEFTVN